MHASQLGRWWVPLLRSPVRPGCEVAHSCVETCTHGWYPTCKFPMRLITAAASAWTPTLWMRASHCQHDRAGRSCS